jgi:hypothetical protein
MNLAGEELSNKYKPAIWLAGSASAEVFADIALCPLEMTKVKIQTSPSGTFPTAFGAALAEMSKTKVETRYPFGSLVPLWSRQVRIGVFFFDCTVYNFSYRSLIPWPSSSSSRRLSRSSTLTFSPNPRSPMPRPLNSESLLLLVTSLVLSALLSPTQLTPSSPSWVSLQTRARALARSHQKLDSSHLQPRVSAPVY